uniref:ComF family protein n=1 Tax=Ningiella ruwaisensis TaxID=2364274 RepID=UPI0010A0270B|nr:ComF family protein [Ningiella ruwaisensis]
MPHFASPGMNVLDQPAYADYLIAPYYQQLFVLGEYRELLQKLISQLKFANKPLVAEVLAIFFMRFVFARISLFEDIPDTIVPVPLSNRRYAKRGYNQARLLSRSLSRMSKIRHFDALKRIKNTKKQTELGREERLNNTLDAFALCRPISCKHIVLVDDVITTGATINEACKAIVKVYPDVHISVWAMAIAPSPKR